MPAKFPTLRPPPCPSTLSRRRERERERKREREKEREWEGLRRNVYQEVEVKKGKKGERERK